MKPIAVSLLLLGLALGVAGCCDEYWGWSSCCWTVCGGAGCYDECDPYCDPYYKRLATSPAPETEEEEEEVW